MKKMIGFIEGVTFSCILCVAMAFGYDVCRAHDRKYVLRTFDEDGNSAEGSVEDET